MSFIPRDWRQIIVDKIAYITDRTPLSSVNPGSVLGTILEATSLEDGEQYFQMTEIVRNYSLNTTSGQDLDDRAAEYGLEREEAKKATTYVTISDSSITKVNTKIYSGLPGPKAGDIIVYSDERTGFPNSGAIIIGRGTNYVETLAYSSITEFTNYVRFNLSSALSYDHGTDETVILSQGGNRVIPAGTRVRVKENDFSAEVAFTIDTDQTLLDGESSKEDISITAEVAGSASNVPAGLINDFVSKPFSTAVVTNPERVTNGGDVESDSELRDRIKLHIQGLSRGIKSAILSAITGLEDTDTNKRVVSANVVETNDRTRPSICYIDDGTGFEPSYDGQGFETIITQATGGEKMLQLDQFPLVKAFTVSGQQEPFNMGGALNLTVEVNGVPETIIFSSSDFENSSQATAEEISRAINLRSNLLESRTIDSGTRVFLVAKSLNNEEIEVTGGTANTILEFPVRRNTTLYLYKNYRTLLSKDGATAEIESGNTENYSFTNGDSLLIRIDGKSGYQIVEFISTDTDAESVIDRINDQLQGGTGVLSSNNNKVSIRSNTENSTGSKVKVGRDSIVTQATSGTVFRDSSLNLDFPYIDQLVDLRVVMTSGTYQGNSQKISAYNPTTGEITLVSTIGGTPSVSDTFVIDGVANGNLGNPATTTGKLGFSYVEAVGKNKDYTLNRSQGQIELEQILAANDIITAGTEYTRGQITTNVAGDYIFLALSTLLISIDGGSDQTITISAGTYSANQLVLLINSTLIGGRASTAIDNPSKLTIRTNRWDGLGSIQVNGGSANTVLDFPTDIVYSLDAHYPYIESGNAYNSAGNEYTFSDTSSLVVVINDVLSSPYSISMKYSGTVTLGDGGAPYTTFRDSGLVSNFSSDDFFKDFFVKMTSGSNQNEMRKITSYTSSTGELVVDSSFTNPIVVSDTYILIPRTAKNVADFFNSTVITGLSLKGYTEEGFNGKVIIYSLTPGSGGSVNVTGGTANSLTVLFLTDGLVGGTFTVSSTLGIMIGQEVVISDNNSPSIVGFITDISGTGPYTLEIRNARSGGSLVDLSSYLVSENAYIRPRNLFNFSTLIKTGLDAYSFYTGLLQKVQWTIDGKEDDLTTYPGVKAAGTQVEVKPPSTNRILVSVDITPIEGVSLSSIQEDVRSAIAGYINNLGVGQDVIIAEIIKKVKEISSVNDVQVLQPSSNIAVGDEEIVRVFTSDIIIG